MAKIVRVDHIAIAVRKLDEARRTLEQNYKAKFLATSENKGLKYRVSVFQLGENIISLVESTDENGFIARFIKERGEGVQHLGIEVDNLEEFVAELEAKGVNVPVKEMEGDDRKEALLGAKDNFGLVLQLIEWKDGPDVPIEKRIERSTQHNEVDR